MFMFINNMQIHFPHLNVYLKHLLNALNVNVNLLNAPNVNPCHHNALWWQGLLGWNKYLRRFFFIKVSWYGINIWQRFHTDTLQLDISYFCIFSSDWFNVWQYHLQYLATGTLIIAEMGSVCFEVFGRNALQNSWHYTKAVSMGPLPLLNHVSHPSLKIKYTQIIWQIYDSTVVIRVFTDKL